MHGDGSGRVLDGDPDGRETGGDAERRGHQGTATCGAVSLLVVLAVTAVTYSLVVPTLRAVPELAGAALVYLVFLGWGVTWLLVTVGYRRLFGGRGRSADDRSGV